MATVYMSTNQLREGEATIEQQLGGRLVTIPPMIYSQEADVSPTPPLVANLSAPFSQGKRSGTGFYRPRYPHSYQHSFIYKDGTSMESNEELAVVLEEDVIVDEAYEAKRRQCGTKVVEIPKAVSDVQAADEDQTVSLEEALAIPEGVEIEQEDKMVAIPEEETIVQETKVPTTPKKDNSRQKQRDRKEHASLTDAARAVTSIVEGEIRSHKEDEIFQKIETVDADKDHNIFNEVEACACTQEEIDVRTRKKKQKGKLRQRMTRASPTVCLGKLRESVASKQGKTMEEEPTGASKEEQLVNGAEVIVGSVDKTRSENQEKFAMKVVNQSKSDIGLKKEKSRLRQRERKKKTETAHKKGVQAAAGETQKVQDLLMMSVWKSLKHVPSLIKQSIDKIFLQVASVTVHIFGYNRTPKRILRLRAELAKKGPTTKLAV